MRQKKNNQAVIPPEPQNSFRDKMYGTTKIGPRGQVVIPAQARVDMNLKAGDQLLVMGKFGRVIGLMKSDSVIEDLVSMLMLDLSDAEMKQKLRAKLNSVLK